MKRSALLSLVASLLVASCAAPAASTRASGPMSGPVAIQAPDTALFQNAARHFTGVTQANVASTRAAKGYALKASTSGTEPWGITVKMRSSPVLPPTMQGLRFRAYPQETVPLSKLITAPPNPPVRDVIVKDKPLEIDNWYTEDYRGWDIAAFGTRFNWRTATSDTREIRRLTGTWGGLWDGDGGLTSLGAGTLAMTGYLLIPAAGTYRFLLSSEHQGGTYFRVGTNIATWTPMTSLLDKSSPMTFNAPGLYTFDYVYDNDGAWWLAMFMGYSDNDGANWKRFPAEAFHIATDGSNPPPAPAPTYIAQGAATLEDGTSFTTSNSYEAGMNTVWDGKMCIRRYVVPSNKYLIIHTVNSRDLIDKEAERANYLPFVTLDNILTDAPLGTNANGLRGSYIYGPGKVVSIGVPMLQPGAKYIPDVVIGGNLLDAEIYEGRGPIPGK